MEGNLMNDKKTLNDILEDYQKIENELIKYETPYLLLCSDSIQHSIFNIKMLNHTINNLSYKKVWANEQYILYMHHII